LSENLRSGNQTELWCQLADRALIMVEKIFSELGQLSPATLSVIVGLIGATGAILGAIITSIIAKFFVTPFLGARDKQDREVEWRKHAIELTKLDLDRKLKTRQASDTSPIRPSILDFLANYRDLQELGDKTPKELYEIIRAKRINVRAASANSESGPPDNKRLTR
jgi:hypothetical protein